MKTITSIVVAIFSATFLTNCASLDASNKEPMLSAAGFVARNPQNAKQQELYNSLPPYKLHRATVKSGVIYAYKDEKKGIAYIGNEAAYQRYQQLAVRQRIANDYYQAAELNREASMGWYGAYGPYAAGGPVIIRR